ncbi:UDP-N-acetylmuramoyl-L-alanine--D-glutamate ligase [Kocuria indica]|uniref:UDP-N-acetylmuramoylalanine--D-glutamate ligase n=1 Tax=Kocuria marina subsp. indica TaxID=1049583 RepID=A0A6N9QVL5_9MICC|nr:MULTISPECIES: UDP-N-acetylmuramoyl-L-alanine--D-glutamate ligase [Kocuria]MCT1615021.1 UDP-N-acetylmuramoyl-L-alanine--D-glutamate ligase [Kocuria marina]NDO76727.1 UDP-N-acetylmuramoyl-L-alanine--D-glutamate ligase [Kocuria indica]
MMHASNDNPVLDDPRLAELTSWDAPWSGLRAVVAGIGVSGFAAADTLIELGALVTVLDSRDTERNRQSADTLKIVGASDVVLGPDAMTDVPDVAGARPDVVITSPGFPPTHPLLASAREEGIQIWGDVELAWRVNRRAGRKTPEWVCITGTNGKTTTVGMTASILQAAGLKAVAVGNVGTPILDALRDPVEYDVLAVELSSFQLHWTYSVSPLASVVLNVAQDHVDWHGSFENYRADKSRVYENTRVACVYNAEQDGAEQLVEDADVIEGCRAVGFTTQTPGLSMVGVVDDLLVDRAFVADRATTAAEIGSIADTGSIPTRHIVANALAAAALARAAGVSPEAVRDGLRAHRPGEHRIQLVAESDGVRWINDSKATNPHAAQASLSAFDSVVWIAGGLSKGVTYDSLVERNADRLRAVVVIGTDDAALLDALSRLAPDVPVLAATPGLDGTTDRAGSAGPEDSGIDPSDGHAVMRRAVRLAREHAEPKDTVLMAPAAASMDQFADYADRGNAFMHGVHEELGF